LRARPTLFALADETADGAARPWSDPSATADQTIGRVNMTNT